MFHFRQSLNSYYMKRNLCRIDYELDKCFDCKVQTIESVVRLFFDILHGIKINDVSFIVAIEFAIFLGYDGQLKQNSDLEMELFVSVINQLKKSKMTKIENALVWLYAKSWNHFGQHLLDEEDLWTFGGEDLEAALMGLTYPRKNAKTERTTELNKMIMERFNNQVPDLVEWARSLHSEVSNADSAHMITKGVKWMVNLRS